MTSRLLPLFVSIDGATVVVTGSGPSAAAVAGRLHALGATVRAVTSEAGASDLEGALLLVAASEEPQADAAILAAAAARPMLAVSAFGPEGRAFLGASEERGSLAVAATTRGRSPELEARLASSAASGISPHHERFAEILGAIRVKLEDRIPDDAVRAAIWEQILDSPVTILLEAGSDDEAVEMAERMAWGTG